MSGSTIVRNRWAGWIPPDPRPPDPLAVPMYGVRPYSRTEFVIDDAGRVREVPRRCSHYGPIRSGSILYCEECAAYGRDHDRRLARDPRTDPKPEPSPPPEPDPEPTRAEKAGRKTSGKMARRRKARRAAEAA